MKEKITKRGIILGVILLVISAGVIPGLSEKTSQVTNEIKTSALPLQPTEKTMAITFFGFGRTGVETQNVMVSVQEATQIYAKCGQLIDEFTINLGRKDTRQLQNELRNLLDLAGLRSNRITEIANTLTSPVQRETLYQLPAQKIRTTIKPTAASSSMRFICNIGSRGVGLLLPPIQLPRPRIFGLWAGIDSETRTSVASILPFGGIIASGVQQGVTLGFIGLGAAFAFPTGPTYMFVGYALMVYITADDIVTYP
jgi:hypothetical protein